MKIDLEEIKSRIFHRVQTGIPPIFKLDISLDDVETLLYGTYVLNVKKRGVKEPISEDTMLKIKKVAEWLVSENKKPGLLLYGKVGTGKTIMANSVQDLVYSIFCNEETKKQLHFLKVTATDLAEYLVKEQMPNEVDGKFLFNQAKKTKLLYIDDIGTENPIIKKYGNEITPFIELLEYRYDNMLTTIITSNLDNQGFENFYNKRVSDRIREMFSTVAYIGESYRK